MAVRPATVTCFHNVFQRWIMVFTVYRLHCVARKIHISSYQYHDIAQLHTQSILRWFLHCVRLAMCGDDLRSTDGSIHEGYSTACTLCCASWNPVVSNVKTTDQKPHRSRSQMQARDTWGCLDPYDVRPYASPYAYTSRILIRAHK